jgi:hypothetical protein
MTNQLVVLLRSGGAVPRPCRPRKLPTESTSNQSNLGLGGPFVRRCEAA